MTKILRSIENFKNSKNNEESINDMYKRINVMTETTIDFANKICDIFE